MQFSFNSPLIWFDSMKKNLMPLATFTVFAGRRKFVDETEVIANAWRQIRRNARVELRTYDGLFDEINSRETSNYFMK